MRGAVKLTAAEWLCNIVLAPRWRSSDSVIRKSPSSSWPRLECSTCPAESDLAIRGRASRHPGLLQRRVALSEFGLYATGTI
jgi:hypothetical protein